MTIGTAHGARSRYERRDGRRVTVHDIQQAEQQGERFVMLTAYDTLVARVFDRVGVPLLLVGDTSGQVVFGYATTVPVTMDHLLTATARSARKRDGTGRLRPDGGQLRPWPHAVAGGAGGMAGRPWPRSRPPGSRSRRSSRCRR
jgi:Ketopantoate hydroxymethyltransferase